VVPIRQNTTVRRVALNALVLSLFAGVAFLEIDNAQLNAAIAQQNTEPIDKPDPEPTDEVPIEPEPVTEVSPIQAIKDKLAADGCNFNADLNIKRKVLGKCKILLIGDSL